MGVSSEGQGSLPAVVSSVRLSDLDVCELYGMANGVRTPTN